MGPVNKSDEISSKMKKAKNHSLKSVKEFDEKSPTKESPEGEIISEKNKILNNLHVKVINYEYQITVLEKQNSDLTRNIELKDDYIKTLQNQNEEMNRVAIENKKLSLEKEELELNLDNKRKECVGCRQHKESIGALKSTNKSYRNELASLTDDKTRLERELTELDIARTKLENENDRLRKQLDRYNSVEPDRVDELVRTVAALSGLIKQDAVDRKRSITKTCCQCQRTASLIVQCFNDAEPIFHKPQRSDIGRQLVEEHRRIKLTLLRQVQSLLISNMVDDTGHSGLMNSIDSLIETKSSETGKSRKSKKGRVDTSDTREDSPSFDSSHSPSPDRSSSVSLSSPENTPFDCRTANKEHGKARKKLIKKNNRKLDVSKRVTKETAKNPSKFSRSITMKKESNKINNCSIEAKRDSQIKINVDAEQSSSQIINPLENDYGNQSKAVVAVVTRSVSSGRLRSLDFVSEEPKLEMKGPIESGVGPSGTTIDNSNINSHNRSDSEEDNEEWKRNISMISEFGRKSMKIETRRNRYFSEKKKKSKEDGEGSRKEERDKKQIEATITLEPETRMDIDCQGGDSMPIIERQIEGKEKVKKENSKEFDEVVGRRRSKRLSNETKIKSTNENDSGRLSTKISEPVTTNVVKRTTRSFNHGNGGNGENDNIDDKYPIIYLFDERENRILSPTVRESLSSLQSKKSIDFNVVKDKDCENKKDYLLPKLFNHNQLGGNSLLSSGSSDPFLLSGSSFTVVENRSKRKRQSSSQGSVGPKLRKINDDNNGDKLLDLSIYNNNNDIENHKGKENIDSMDTTGVSLATTTDISASSVVMEVEVIELTPLINGTNRQGRHYRTRSSALHENELSTSDIERNIDVSLKRSTEEKIENDNSDKISIDCFPRNEKTSKLPDQYEFDNNTEGIEKSINDDVSDKTGKEILHEDHHEENYQNFGEESLGEPVPQLKATSTPLPVRTTSEAVGERALVPLRERGTWAENGNEVGLRGLTDDLVGIDFRSPKMITGSMITNPSANDEQSLVLNRSLCNVSLSTKSVQLLQSKVSQTIDRLHIQAALAKQKLPTPSLATTTGPVNCSITGDFSAKRKAKRDTDDILLTLHHHDRSATTNESPLTLNNVVKKIEVQSINPSQSAKQEGDVVQTIRQENDKIGDPEDREEKCVIETVSSQPQSTAESSLDKRIDFVFSSLVNRPKNELNEFLSTNFVIGSEMEAKGIVDAFFRFFHRRQTAAVSVTTGTNETKVLIDIACFLIISIIRQCEKVYNYYYKCLLSAIRSLNIATPTATGTVDKTSTLILVNLSFYVTLQQWDFLIGFLIDLIRCPTVKMLSLVTVITPETVFPDIVREKYSRILQLIKRLVRYECSIDCSTKPIQPGTLKFAGNGKGDDLPTHIQRFWLDDDKEVIKENQAIARLTDNQSEFDSIIDFIKKLMNEFKKSHPRLKVGRLDKDIRKKYF